MKKVEIIIPKLDNDGSDNSDLIEETIRGLCELYGGATAYEAKGYWLNEGGRLFVDQNVVIISAVPANEGPEEIRRLGRLVLDGSDQEAVFISVDNKSEIIE